MEETTPLRNEPLQDVEVDGDDQLTDSGRNWSPDVLLELVKIWRRVFLDHPDWSRVQRMQLVYDAFIQTVDCSQRSRKAVDDKLYSMKQMYQFIAQVRDQFKQGGPDKTQSPSWFELTKEERRVVRTLHRVRIPDISMEVYNVFDSVLSPSAVAARKPTLEGVTPDGSRALAPSPSPTDDSQEITQEILDVKRNWSYDVTLQLARVWNNVHNENPALRGATLSLNVYNAFMAAVGGSNRSRKAVDDKMHSMREMYRFMKNYETKRVVMGEPNTPWFDLTKPERRGIRSANKIRVPNLAPDVYNELDMLMTRMNQISPSETLIESVSTPVSSVDLKNTYIVTSNNGGTSTPGQSSQANAVISNDQPGQITCECGSKRLLEIAPAIMNNNGSLHQQQINRPTPITTTPNVQTPVSYYPVHQASVQGTPKRQRTNQEQVVSIHYPNTMPNAVVTDTQTARDLIEQMRLSMAQDREERRQQHIEQMSALREIAALLKQRR